MCFCDFSVNQRELRGGGGGNSPSPPKSTPYSEDSSWLPMFGECNPKFPYSASQKCYRPTLNPKRRMRRGRGRCNPTDHLAKIMGCCGTAKRMAGMYSQDHIDILCTTPKIYHQLCPDSTARTHPTFRENEDRFLPPPRNLLTGQTPPSLALLKIEPAFICQI